MQPAGKDQLLKIAPEFGIEVVASEVYDKGATDLSAVVAKLMANKDIQAVVNWSIVPAQAIIAKNMRQAGWDVPLFQSHGFGNIKYVEVDRELHPVGNKGERFVLVDPPASLNDRYRSAEFYREGDTLYLVSSASSNPRILVCATASAVAPVMSDGSR